jgi:hypothetical protein
MRIIDTDPNGGNITITSPLSEANLKGCHPVQNVGACETYARRYLWVAALEIVEHDALDATTGKTEKKDGVSTDVSVSPTSEAFKALQPEVQDRMRKLAVKVSAAESTSAMLDIIDFEDLDNDQKAGLWALLDSKVRASIKKAQQEQKV